MPLRRPTHPGRVAIVVGGLVLAANLGALALLTTETDDAAAGRPTAVEALFPEEGSVVRRQETVGVDLQTGYTGVLTINALRIPEDQYRVDESLGQVLWQPGEDQEFDALPTGTVEMVVTFWPVELSEDEARSAGRIESFRWRFTVGA